MWDDSQAEKLKGFLVSLLCDKNRNDKGYYSSERLVPRQTCLLHLKTCKDFTHDGNKTALQAQLNNVKLARPVSSDTNGLVNSPVKPLDEKDFRLWFAVLARSTHLSDQADVGSHVPVSGHRFIRTSGHAVVTATRVRSPGSDNRVVSQLALAIQITLAFLLFSSVS